jgi:predicted RecA/RadA family phage recombinase
MLVTHGRALTVAVRHPHAGGDMEGQISRIVELPEEDAAGIRGGNPIQIAAMLVGAFGAGFNFGYYELAPRLFD